jgi:hypothetical protein
MPKPGVRFYLSGVAKVLLVRIKRLRRLVESWPNAMILKLIVLDRHGA